MTKRKDKKHKNADINSMDLFKRGNVGLARLLIAVSNSGPSGVATYKLLHQLGSTHHAKAFIKRAEKEGYIKRVEGESTSGQFKPVYNLITPKGRELLSSLRSL